MHGPGVCMHRDRVGVGAWCECARWAPQASTCGDLMQACVHGPCKQVCMGTQCEQACIGLVDVCVHTL